MAYLSLGNEIVCDLGKPKERFWAKVRGAFTKHSRLIFDN